MVVLETAPNLMVCNTWQKSYANRVSAKEKEGNESAVRRAKERRRSSPAKRGNRLLKDREKGRGCALGDGKIIRLCVERGR